MILRMRSNGLKLWQERVSLNIRKHFFSERGMTHWHRLPREVVVSPSLHVFKNCGDVALRGLVSGHGGNGWWLDLGILEPFPNPSVSVFL